MVARLPRRAAAVSLIEREAAWLPRLPELPIPISELVFAGAPNETFPYPWLVLRFQPGMPLSRERLAHPNDAADRLGRFVKALHVGAPEDAPHNAFRGIALSQRDERFQQAADRLAHRLDVTRLRAHWRELRDLPAESGFWLHGDLHPGNILGYQGEITAVVDFGDLCAGDPATDLAIAWMLFGKEAREIFRKASGASDSRWQRGRGWAIAISSLFLASESDDAHLQACAANALCRAVSGHECVA